MPPDYVRTLASHNISLGDDTASLIWNASRTLEAMDRRGVGAAILSVSYPGVFFPSLPLTDAQKLDLAVSLASSTNAFLASPAVRGSRSRPAAPPTGSSRRFGGFATLPLPGVDEALAEIHRALDPPGYGNVPLDGVVLYSNYDGIYLGDRRFDPVYEALDARRAVVFVHPTSPKGPSPTPDIPFWLLDFVFDTTRAFVSMVQNGTLDRYPNIRWVAAHGGGTLPFLADRIQELKGDPRYGVKGDPLTQLRRLYYDTTNLESGTAVGLESLTALLARSNSSSRKGMRGHGWSGGGSGGTNGTSNKIVYGDDYPMMTQAKLDSEKDGLASFFRRSRFSAEQQAAWEHDNALALLGGAGGR